MKKHPQICILIACVTVVSAAAQTLERTPEGINQPGVKLRPIFNGTVSLNVHGRAEAVPVALYGISLWDHRSVTDLKPLASGLALIQFEAGKTETLVNGVTNRSKAGDFLLVEHGSDVAFRVRSEAATFEAVVLGGAFADAKIPDDHRRSAARRLGRYETGAGGVLTRVTIPALQVGQFSVEVQDFLVGPAKKTEVVGLPGGAILEINCANGVLNMRGRSQVIKGGSIVIVNDGESFELINYRDDLGLSFRATILRSQ